MRTLLLGFALIGLVLVVATLNADDGPPRVSYLDGTPGDVMALGDSTFADILETFPDQVGCLRDVTVAHSWDLGPEAGFYQGNHIEIEVPNSRERIRRTYVHEFGHHLDANCSDAQLRSEFTSAMGHPDGTDWYSDGRPWHQRPSEQFAEAVVVVVGGSPTHTDMTLTVEAIRIVETWSGS